MPMLCLKFAIILLACLLVSAFSGPPVNVVVSVRGKKFDVKAETVRDVLENIEKTAGLEGGQQHVLFRGKVLSTDDSLSDVGVSSGDVLNVVKKRSTKNRPTPPQGMPSSKGPLSLDSFGLDNEAFRKATEDIDPEEVKKAMQAMDNILDSNFINEFFGDDEKMEKTRLQMLDNIDSYESAMPGFKDQALEIASDPVKWKEAMQQAKDQILLLKQKRDARKGDSKPKSKSVDDVNEQDEE